MKDPHLEREHCAQMLHPRARIPATYRLARCQLQYGCPRKSSLVVLCVRVDGAGFYDIYTGKCFRNAAQTKWLGMQPGTVEDEGDDGDESKAVRIGLLLDLDVGSLTVYKNDTRLGNMIDGRWSENGALEGKYSWALSTRRQGTHQHARFGREYPHTDLLPGLLIIQCVLNVANDSMRHQETASKLRRRAKCTSRVAPGELLSA